MTSRRFVSIGAVILSGHFAALTHGVSVSPAEMEEAGRWVAAKFKGTLPDETPRPGLSVVANHDPVQLNARGGRPMRIVDREYRRGLYCHAVSKVIVRLPAPGRSFHAIAGVDSNEQTAGGRGSVIFSVRVHGKEAFRSGLMREGMPGVSVTADLAGQSEFALEVGDGDDGISCDQADWADARAVLADGREVWLGDLPMLAAGRPPYTTEPPISFVYGGRPSSELLKQWAVNRETRRLDERRSSHTLTWADPKSGLVVRCVGIE